jgi:hypothetical protein
MIKSQAALARLSDRHSGASLARAFGAPAEGVRCGAQLLQVRQQVILASWPEHAAVCGEDAGLTRNRAACCCVVACAVQAEVRSMDNGSSGDDGPAVHAVTRAIVWIRVDGSCV